MAPKPETGSVQIGKYRVVTYSYGTGENVLFLLNGGPGLPCNYLREPMLRMVEDGYRVVIYDQLGCGASDRPKDPALWTISRYVEEVETVRQSLGLGQVHLLGHSWGGWLSIEYALTFPQALKSLVLSNTCADMLHRARADQARDAVRDLVAINLFHEGSKCGGRRQDGTNSTGGRR